MGMYRFRWWRSVTDNQYYFHFIAPNGEVMFASEGYYNKQDMLDSIDSIKRSAADADVVEVEY